MFPMRNLKRKEFKMKFSLYFMLSRKCMPIGVGLVLIIFVVFGKQGGFLMLRVNIAVQLFYSVKFIIP